MQRKNNQNILSYKERHFNKWVPAEEKGNLRLGQTSEGSDAEVTHLKYRMHRWI